MLYPESSTGFKLFKDLGGWNFVLKGTHVNPEDLNLLPSRFVDCTDEAAFIFRSIQSGYLVNLYDKSIYQVLICIIRNNINFL